MNYDSDKTKANLERFFPLLLILTLFFLGLKYVIPIRTTDWRLAVFYHSDATYSWIGFVEMASRHEFLTSKSFFLNGYGFFYFYISYVILLLRELIFGGLDMLDHYMSMRWTCFIFSLGSLTLYFPLARVYRLPTWFPYFAIFSTLTYSPFIQLSLEPKPDTLQYFFILLSIIFLRQYSRKGGMKNLILSSLNFGLAAAAKLAGFFYYPFILIISSLRVFNQFKERNIKRSMAFQILKNWGFITAIFHFTYLLLNLRWFFDFHSSLDFFKRANEYYWNKSGEIWSWLAWKYIWKYGFFLTGSYFLWTLYVVKQMLTCSKKNRMTIIQDETLTFFPLFMMSIISLIMHDFVPDYYLLPVLPILLISSAKVISLTWLWWNEKVSRLYFRRAIPIILFFLLLTGDYNRISSIPTYLDREIHFTKTTRFQSGRYLAQHYPLETRFFRFYYWWLPADFHNERFFMYSAPYSQQIASLDADVILVCDGESNRYIKNIVQFREALQAPDSLYILKQKFHEQESPDNYFEIYEHKQFKDRLEKRRFHG